MRSRLAASSTACMVILRAPTHGSGTADLEPRVGWQPGHRVAVREDTKGQFDILNRARHQSDGVETFGGRLDARRIDGPNVGL